MQISRRHCVITIFMVVTFALSGCRPSPAPTRAVTPTAYTSTFDPSTTDIPYNLISAERMLDHLEVLTNIQAYSGFRTAATTGEAEAFDYVAGQLAGMDGFKAMGMTLERQPFEVFITTEIHNSQFFLTGTDGMEVEVRASGLRGSRYVTEHSLYFDTDGKLGDLHNDPVTADGKIVVIQDARALSGLSAEDVAGRILVVDVSLFDAITTGEYEINRLTLFDAIDKGAAGLVLVSHYSNAFGDTHGSFINEGTFLQNMLPGTRVPILAVHLEDLALAGIKSWDDLGGITSARMLLDSDVLSPASSQNLIARIPGKDSSRALILTAHLDSPNTPGGFDDGSGSVILLEMAEVLNETRLQPDVDLYLMWNGSHENGIYGSAYFAATHGELLDSALAELTVDCLGLPLDGKESNLTLDFNSYARYGDAAAGWQDYLAGQAAKLGITVTPYDEFGLIADNSNFDTWNVPEADLIYFNPAEMEQFGNAYIHYANHWHDSYETVDVVSQVSDVLVKMAKVALTAAIQTGRDAPKLRTKIPTGRRALFVASHTQPASMITSLRELGMALAYEGFDVDPIPYGQPVTPADLKDVGIVVLLPTYDYPGDADETWSQGELDALKAYVDAGGLLVVTNSDIGHIMTVPISDPNEDRLDINLLLESFGVAFEKATYNAEMADAAVSNDLTRNAETLMTYGTYGVTFVMDEGQVLYNSHGQPIVALVESGKHGGQVLVIGDLGLLIDNDSGVNNLQFLRNLAAYAKMK
jgi:hypothetical protein